MASKKRYAAKYSSKHESRCVLESILNEWLVYKNFLQLSVVGQVDNMIAGCMISVTASKTAKWNKRCEGNQESQQWKCSYCLWCSPMSTGHSWRKDAF